MRIQKNAIIRLNTVRYVTNTFKNAFVIDCQLVNKIEELNA
jgi:hypothetical protein